MNTAESNETKEREFVAEQREERDHTVKKSDGDSVVREEDPKQADTSVGVDAQAESIEGAKPEDVSDNEQPIEPIARQLTELTQQAEDHYNRYLRVQADFDNFRRRTQREKEELAQYASLKLVEQLLPVLDNFERAMQVGAEGEEQQSFFKGMDMIRRQLLQVLEAEGLRAMEAVGEAFDPELHQAVMRVESEDHEEGIVVEVMQTGYWLKDKVLRPAMVKVSG